VHGKAGLQSILQHKSTGGKKNPNNPMRAKGIVPFARFVSPSLFIEMDSSHMISQVSSDSGLESLLIGGSVAFQKLNIRGFTSDAGQTTAGHGGVLRFCLSPCSLRINTD
jgi:hypothetical protein